MIRLGLFLAFLWLQVFCSRDDSQAASKVPDVIEKLSFREEVLVIKEEPPLNYHFALLLVSNFPEAYDLKLIMGIIRECRKSPLSAEDGKRKCRRFTNPFNRKLCEIALATFYTPYGSCFLQEETDRKSLRQRGVDIINTGVHGTDLLHILNRIRGGRMTDEEEVLYYVKRFQLYTDISRDEWRPLVDRADKLISDEWLALYANSSD